jgi:hypothetical protein
VPIAVPGMMIGVFFLLGFLLPKQHLEGTNHFLAIVNFIGCLGLFLYSIIFLKGLCPMCFHVLCLLCYFWSGAFVFL